MNLYNRFLSSKYSYKKFFSQIAGLRFTFLINQELISVIRQEAVKLNLNP